MVRIVIATILAAAGLFVWGFASWVLLNLHEPGWEGLAPGDNRPAQLVQMFPHDGVYYFPGMPEHTGASTAEAKKALMDQWKEAHRAGPVGQVRIIRNGFEPMEPMVFAKGFALNLATAFLVALLVAKLAQQKTSLLVRVAAGACAMFAGQLYAYGSDWIWMYAPGEFIRPYLIDAAVSSAIVGVVLGFVITPGAFKGKPEPQMA